MTSCLLWLLSTLLFLFGKTEFFILHILFNSSVHYFYLKLWGFLCAVQSDSAGFSLRAETQTGTTWKPHLQRKTVGFKDTEDYFCLHPPPPRITIFKREGKKKIPIHARAGVCEVSGQVFKPDLTSPHAAVKSTLILFCSLPPCSLCLFKPCSLYLLLYLPPHPRTTTTSTTTTFVPVFSALIPQRPATPPPLLLYLLLYLFLLKSQSSSFASRLGRAGRLFLGFY